MFSDARVMAGTILAGIGSIFLIVGLIFMRVSFDQDKQIDQIEALPLLTVVQLGDTPPGAKAVIEGHVAERNLLHVNGYVAYISYQYQGERCTRDDDGYNDCESIWSEQERITPDLWLDLSGGRARLINTDYSLEHAPVIWQTTDTLVDYETLEYNGFKINSPVFSVGATAQHGDTPAFNADFIYGGNRDAYLTNERANAGSLFRFSFVFSALGGLFVIVGGALLLFGLFR